LQSLRRHRRSPDVAALSFREQLQTEADAAAEAANKLEDVPAAAAETFTSDHGCGTAVPSSADPPDDAEAVP
jgi:hypothetical protein